MTYLLLKILHIGSVVLFLGNIVAALFWAAHARRTADFGVIATTLEGIARSDRLFTVPGVIGIVLSGFAAAILGRIPLLSTGWLLWPIVLLSVSGFVFSARVVPLQRRLLGLVRGADSLHPAFASFDPIYRQWLRWVWLALVAPVAALAIMVLKPNLPGL